jgi:hypothetical protein
MIPSLEHPIRRYAEKASQLAAWLALLSIASPPAVAAQVSYTGTGYLVAVPVPGVLCTNSAGQVAIKGNVHILRVETTDPRMTGRLQAAMDLAYQADGTTTFSGPAAQEVGSWDLADPLNPRFIPTGGVWDLQYRGISQPDQSSQVTFTGYGIGGAIEGLRVTQTVVRGPGVVFDPAIPYTGSGVISTRAVDTRVVIDNFDNAPAPYWSAGAGAGQVAVMEREGKFTIRGSWPIATRIVEDTTAWCGPSFTWSVGAGRTLETRVDLVELAGPGAGAVLALFHDSAIGYWVLKSSDYVVMGKMTEGQAFLSAEPVLTPNTNVILTLGITPSGTNVLFTARILDRGSAGKVLYEHTLLDTPLSDRSLTAAEVQAATGMALQVRTDPREACWTRGTWTWLGVYQYTDGKLSPAEATFDNFEVRTYAVPQVAVERAVRLSWPESTVGRFGVECAPTALGPFVPLHHPVWPGIRQWTVPASGDMQYFRLREIP